MRLKLYKIRKSIKQFTELIEQIREAIGPIVDNSTNNSGSGVTKSKKSNQRIEIKHMFKDITDGATHYHADYIADPRWSKFLEKTVKIDTHIFYR